MTEKQLFDLAVGLHDLAQAARCLEDQKGQPGLSTVHAIMVEKSAELMEFLDGGVIVKAGDAA